MVLSNEARGMVEKCIDNMLSTIPPLVQFSPEILTKRICDTRNPTTLFLDTFGEQFQGSILPMLLPFSLQQDTPVEETFEEVRRMLEIRSAEIHDNIANTA